MPTGLRMLSAMVNAGCGITFWSNIVWISGTWRTLLMTMPVVMPRPCGMKHRILELGIKGTPLHIALFLNQARTRNLCALVKLSRFTLRCITAVH